MHITNEVIKEYMDLKSKVAELTKMYKQIEDAIKENGPVNTKEFAVGIKETEVKEYVVKAHTRKQVVIVEKGA